MKRTSRPFNDGYYCQTVEEFEDKTFAQRDRDAGFVWARNMLLPVLMIGSSVARSDWLLWVPVLGAASLVWLVFLFLHEINENVGFVRHQLRAFRDAVNVVGGRVEEEYTNPDYFTIAVALQWLNREWERPTNPGSGSV